MESVLIFSPHFWGCCQEVPFSSDPEGHQAWSSPVTLAMLDSVPRRRKGSHSPREGGWAHGFQNKKQKNSTHSDSHLRSCHLPPEPWSSHKRLRQGIQNSKDMELRLARARRVHSQADTV